MRVIAYERTSYAPGPVILSRSFLVNTACKSAPLKLTPMTCPVVRNKYVTNQESEHMNLELENPGTDCPWPQLNLHA